MAWKSNGENSSGLSTSPPAARRIAGPAVADKTGSCLTHLKWVHVGLPVHDVIYRARVLNSEWPRQALTRGLQLPDVPSTSQLNGSLTPANALGGLATPS
jgi:hypothetical protein